MPVSSKSIGEIVAEHPSAATVFQRFEIDLCSHADAPLELACAKLQLSVEQVLEKLEEAYLRESGSAEIDPNQLSTERLIQHIVRVHHQYIRQELPALVEMARRVAAKHGERQPELSEVAMLVAKLQVEILAHIEKEEQILFPFLSQVAQGLPIVHTPSGARFDSVSLPVRMMTHEHKAVDQALNEIHRLTNGFESPLPVCGTHAALLAGLRAFDEDLRRHVHLEDDILFPRALQLESEVGQEK